MSNIENVIRQLWNDSIEFLHVVCYYDTDCADVTAFVRDILTYLSNELGGEECLGVNRASFYCGASLDLPREGWEDGGGGAAVKTGKLVSLDSLSSDDLVSVAPSISEFMVERHTRLMHERLAHYDRLWRISLNNAKPHWASSPGGTFRLSVRTDLIQAAAIRDYLLRSDKQPLWNRALNSRADSSIADNCADCIIGAYPEVRELSLRLVTEVLSRCHKVLKPFHALVDCSDHRANGAGDTFTDSDGYENGASLQSQVERQRWRALKERRCEKIRGVHWGMYLSPIHLSKLGGREQFRSEFMSQLEGVVDREERFIAYDEGSVLIKLTSVPIDFSKYSLGWGIVNDIGGWVHQRFRVADLLP